MASNDDNDIKHTVPAAAAAAPTHGNGHGGSDETPPLLHQVKIKQEETTSGDEGEDYGGTLVGRGTTDAATMESSSNNNEDPTGAGHHKNRVKEEEDDGDDDRKAAAFMPTRSQDNDNSYNNETSSATMADDDSSNNKKRLRDFLSDGENGNLFSEDDDLEDLDDDQVSRACAQFKALTGMLQKKKNARARKVIEATDPVFLSIKPCSYHKNFGLTIGLNEDAHMFKFGLLYFACSSKALAEECAWEFKRLFKEPEVVLEDCKLCGMKNVGSLVDLNYHRHHGCLDPMPPAHERDTVYMPVAFPVCNQLVKLLQQTKFPGDKKHDLIDWHRLPNATNSYLSEHTAKHSNREKTHANTTPWCSLFTLAYDVINQGESAERKAAQSVRPVKSSGKNYSFFSSLPFLVDFQYWPVELQEIALKSDRKHAERIWMNSQDDETEDDVDDADDAEE